jgi:hypothetical protein
MKHLLERDVKRVCNQSGWRRWSPYLWRLKPTTVIEIAIPEPIGIADRPCVIEHLFDNAAPRPK